MQCTQEESKDVDLPLANHKDNYTMKRESVFWKFKLNDSKYLHFW